MDFLRALTDEHHRAFQSLLFGESGVIPKPVQQKRVKTSKRTVPKLKLQPRPVLQRKTQRKPVKTIKQSNNSPSESPKPVQNDAIEPEQVFPIYSAPESPIKQPEVDELPFVAESQPIEVATVESVTESSTVTNLLRQLYVITTKQSVKDLERFLRTNATKININEFMTDPKLECRGGPFLGWTASHIASWRGDLEMIKVLVAHGANINLLSSLQRESCLAVATWKGHLDVVEYLLDNKADINSQNGNRGNQQPIHICSIIPGRDHIAKFLVQRGANYKSATMSYGAQTPVELAARQGNLTMLQYLFDLLKLTNSFGLLSYAFESGDSETIRYILSSLQTDQPSRYSFYAGELIRMLNFRPELTSAIEIFATKCNWLSYSNPFPLQIVQHGQLEALKVIVANSGNYHSRVGYFQYDGWNLIEYACLYRQLQILEFFISSKVVPSTKALNLAVRNQWIEGVSVLLKANVVLDNRQEHDDTTLHSAVRTGNEEIVKLLLDAPNGNKMLQMFNSFGMAPLHVAADKLKFEIVKILLERGANANLKNSKTDHTPVHYVCTVTTDQGMPTRIALVDLLVQHGADLTLTCVTQFGKQSVVELACASDSLVTHLILNGAPKMSIAEINRKREEARKRLGQICMFEDAVPSECAIEENLVYGNFQHSGVQSHGEIKESHSSKSSGVHFTQTIIPWRTIRLFLSSTFLDMQAEREYLIKRVIPKVKERLAAQKIQLIEIDLRWGVTEEEIQSGSGLEVCLSGEKNSDLFCGILGSRYGWVPSPKQITDTVRYEYVWEDGKSITEMEINEGAFRRLDGKARSFFFFRDSAVRFPDQVKSIYEESNPTYTSQLTQLKETIKRSGYPVFEYRPRVAVASSGTSLTELEDLGAQFERHILATVKTLYPENQQVITDPLLLEREYHSGFVELRSSGFIGRTQLVSDIKSMIEGSFEGSCPPVVISGEAGSGKSSLVAKLTHDLLQENSIHELFIVYHFIGGSPSSVSIRNTLHRICSELVRAFELHIEVQEEFDGLVTQFQSVLESIANRNQKRVLIILDALNQLDYSNQSHTLHWLPQNFPNGITALVSCLPSDCLNVLEQRKIPTHIHLPVLSKENCQEIVSQTLARYKKKFTGHQLETILSKSGAVNPLYLTIVCEEFRVFGDFSKLDQKLNQLAQDVPGLLDQVLARMELDHGREIVANCLGLLECGRFGLLEEELLAITKLSRYQWGEIFLSLKFFLRPIGSSDSEKVLDFFHRQISKAVHRRYFENNPDLQKRIHSDLGLFFLEKISPSTNASNGWKLNFVQDYARGYSEVIYHLFHAQEYAGVSVLLSSLKFIEKKCTLGFTYGLVEDYLLFNTATHLDKKLGILVNPYMDFVLGNTHVFDRYPYVVLQMALNEPGKSPLCDIARKELARQAKSRPTPLFIWENKPLTPKNQQQFKSLNIGARTNCALGSPDGKLIATGDINGSVKVYSASTAELQGILISAPTRINSISFSADGKYLAGGAGSVLYFWEITTKLLIYQISHDILNEILGVHFNPISSGANYSIVACGNGFVKFDVNLSTRSHSVQSLPSEHTGMVTCCSFSHDGNRLLSGSADKKVVLYNNLSGKIQTTVFTGHSKLVKGCAFAPSGNWWVSCSQDRTLMVWNANGAIATLAGHSDNVESCAITPDEKFIISGGWDKCVVIWSVADILAKKPEPAFANIGEHSHFINHVASYGANAVISSSADMTVKLFHLPSSIAEFKEAHSAEASQHTDLICCMDYNPAKQQFVTASWDKTAKVFSNDGTEIALLGEHTKRVNDAAYFPKSYDFIATAATDHTVKIWNEKFICEKTLTGHTDKVMSVAVSHDDRYIASGAADKTIRFWDASTGNCISTIQAHSGWVCALRFSPCSRLLASGSVDSSVKIWSTKDGVLLGTLRKHTNPVLDLSFAQNGNILISGGEDWKARVWQVGTWECICELSGHQHEVTAIVVLDDVPEYREMFKCNTILATASADRTIRIWNYMTGEQLWIHVAPGAFSYLVYMDNLTFAAGDSRGRVYILKLQHS